MIDYFGGILLIAYRNQIVYTYVDDYDVEILEESKDVITVTISEDQVNSIKLKSNLKIIALQELGENNGSNSSSVVLENLVSRQISFFRILKAE